MAGTFRDLLATSPPERQERIRRGTGELIAEMPLHELRRARELSQEHLAKAMSQSQSAISRLERRTDMYISTLRRYIAVPPFLSCTPSSPCDAVEDAVHQRY